MARDATGPETSADGLRLSRDEEIELAQRSVAGDRWAAARLVKANLRFVVQIAKRHRRYGVPLADLLQEGTIGLMEAIRRFNPDRNARLSTYAVWWIRAAIQDHIVRSGSLVRLGTSARRRAKLFGRPVPDAGEASGPVEPVVAVGTEGLVEQLPDDRPTPEEWLVRMRELRHRLTRLPAALKTLSPRERAIIVRRFLAEPAWSRSSIGRELGVSKERVRQLEMRALQRLREVIQPGIEALPVERRHARP